MCSSFLRGFELDTELSDEAINRIAKAQVCVCMLAALSQPWWKVLDPQHALTPVHWAACIGSPQQEDE